MKIFSSIILSLFFFSSGYSQSDFAVGVNAGLSLPVGQLTEFYSSGYGGNGQFMYNVSDQFMVALTVGYSKWDVDQDAVNAKAGESGKDITFNLQSDLRVFPLYIGARYYLASGKHRPFFSVDFGGYSYEFKLAGDVTIKFPGDDLPDVTVPLEERTQTGTETALALGLGYFYKISKHFYIEINSKYNVLTDATTINDPDSIYDPDDPTSVYGIKGTIAYFTFMAGIDYRF
ncbi:MAG: outer membrane beta-barrel protein [Ignavibacteriaceae bacterium]